MSNCFELKFKATLSNELLARNSLTSFLSPYNLGLDEISEFKTIVSEAVSNAIIHGYKFDSNKYVYLKAVNCNLYLQNLCFPIVIVIGLDQIHLFVAVAGLK